MNSMMKPWRITLDTNPEDCNLACIMCEEHSPFRVQPLPKPRRMSAELLERSIRQAAALGVKEVIPSTMGEPLLYAHFDLIVGLCRELGLSLNLTTNGSFPKKGVEEWAKALLPLCSDIKISVNGLESGINEQIMHKTNTTKQWDNIRTLVGLRNQMRAQGKQVASLTLQVTFLEMNLLEIPKLAEAAIDLGIERLKGHHLWVHGEAMKYQNMRRNQESIDRWNQVVDQLNQLAQEKPLESGEHLKLANVHHLNREKPEELKEGGQCPFLGQEIWVNPLGEFSPCCAPDELRQGLGKFGNLEHQSLSAILQSEGYQNLVQNYQDQALCQSCNMKV